MLKTSNKKYCSLLSFIVILATISKSFGQVSWTDSRWIRIGSYQNFYSAWGSEYSIPGNGCRWPSWYTLTDNFVNKRPLWGVRDFTDASGNFYDIIGWQIWSDKNFSFGVPIKLRQIAKFEMPSVYVDGVDVTQPYRAEVDTINPMIIADRIVENVVNTSMGITLKRKIYAFGQQYHDTYHILEYTYINTGNIDEDPEIELPGQQIKDLYIGEHIHYHTSKEAMYTVDWSQIWGNAQWISSRGETYGQSNQTEEDSISCFFSWMGLHDRVSWDNIAGPDLEGNGRLTAPQFVGQMFLYAPVSADDPTNNPKQPVTLGWNGNDNYPNPMTGDVALWNRLYSFLKGNMVNGDTTDMWEQYKDKVSYPIKLTDPGGAATVVGYGPYTLDFGDSITIIRAEGVNGLSRKMCEDLGAEYIKSYRDPSTSYNFEMPDGSIITGSYNDGTADQFKNTWFYTGIDSIMKTFSRAKRNYKANYEIPEPPPPPRNFIIDSGGDRIFLQWSDESESVSDFAGYRIYRGVGRPDTTYSLIFECGLETDHPEVVHEFSDQAAQRGFSYYYYIVAYNDGTQNNSSLNPHGSLHSSPYYTRSTLPARLKLKAGDSLNAIRVVPNPYNRSAREIQYGTQAAEQDKIMFFDIPGHCTIRIFSERGDLIKTIRHEDGSGDEVWPSVSEHRQVIVSGVYIAHFEVTQDQYDSDTGELLYRKGDTAMEKFAIIR